MKTIKSMKRLFLSAVLTLPMVLGGCIIIDSGAPATEAPPAPRPEIITPANPDFKLPAPLSQPPLPDFVSVVGRVNPSVVAINTEVTTFDIFNLPSTQKGAGSGWVIDRGGHIVTNNHVIEGAKSITVTLTSGAALSAAVVGTDPLTDIAVLKVTSDNLVPAQIGDSSRLRPGEWVLAIGNALGRGISVKEGIISRLGVTIAVDSGQNLYDLVETSAAINPGNSGGPLVNMSGEVIGITSAKLAAVGVEGMGYAISTNIARPIIQELAQKGYVVRPWLGVVLQSVNQFLALRYKLPVQKGAFVTEVSGGSPADKAGLKAGDVVVGVNDKDVGSADDLIRTIHSGRIDQQVRITYWRSNQKNTTTATLATSPAPARR